MSTGDRRRSSRVGVLAGVCLVAVITSGCTAGEQSSAPEPSPAAPSSTAPSSTIAPPSSTATETGDSELVTAVEQAVHSGSEADSGSGPMPPQLNHAQVDTADAAVQLVFACSGGQVLELQTTAGDEQSSDKIACDGQATSVDFSAGPRSEVSFATDSIAEGAYAYQWYVG